MAKKITTLLLAVFFLLSLALPAMAGDCKGGQCPMKNAQGGCGKSGGSCGNKEYQCPIVAKLMKKAHFFLENQKEIGLSEDQVQAIKAIKIEAKKSYIRQEAEMKIFEMDLDQKLSEPKVDVEALNAMMDSASAGFAQGGKATVASYAKLKAVLKDDQMAKAKEIWKSQKPCCSRQ